MITDPNKPVQTRSGRKARIYATDGIDGEWHGAIKYTNGWVPMVWHNGGHFFTSGNPIENDLINVPEEVVRWFNLYDDNHRYAFIGARLSRVEADQYSTKGRVGLLKLTYINGKPVKAELEDSK